MSNTETFTHTFSGPELLGGSQGERGEIGEPDPIDTGMTDDFQRTVVIPVAIAAAIDDRFQQSYELAEQSEAYKRAAREIFREYVSALMQREMELSDCEYDPVSRKLKFRG